ncbi:hypothetical protein, partial [Atlantibacter hermannii]|uniref:hypothetical protein n=1 Tax=Atlantibacter hermannii TaxID=565 RepID=UPI0028A6D3AC
MSMRNAHSDKRRLVKKIVKLGALSHRNKNSPVKHKKFKVRGVGTGIKIAEPELTSQVRPAWT